MRKLKSQEKSNVILYAGNDDVVEMLRPMIRQYFRKSLGPYRGRTAWGITQMFQRYFKNAGTEEIIKAGDLEKAMLLEGFKGYRDKWGLVHFNVNKTDCDVFELAVTSVVYGCKPKQLKKRLKKLFPKEMESRSLIFDGNDAVLVKI